MIVFAVLFTAFSALVQGTIGFGFAVLSVPVLSLVDPQLAPVPQLLVTLPMTVFMVWRERTHLDLHGVGWVLAGRIPGAILGLVLLETFTETALEVTIAVIVLGAVAIIATGVSVVRTRATQFGAGVASGTSGLVASVGGPPVALLYRDAAGGTVRSSLAAIFTIGIIISIFTRGVSGNISRTDVEVAVVLLPAVLVGLWASRWFTGWAEGRYLRGGILALSALAALGLIVRALVD